jgi:hypothetical protein
VKPLDMSPEVVVARRRAVFDLSTYNAVNMARRATNVHEVAQMLLKHWNPSWAPADVVVSRSSVRDSAKRLEALGLVVVSGDGLDVPVRGYGGMGRPLSLNAQRTAVLA